MTNAITVRYVVDNVDETIHFYEDMLGFATDMHPAPGFAALSKGNLRLLLNQPGAGGAGQETADGQTPRPGGWNRFQIAVENLERWHSELKEKGAHFRGEIIEGNGGKQALLEDPSGNVIELLEPKER